MPAKSIRKRSFVKELRTVRRRRVARLCARLQGGRTEQRPANQGTQGRRLQTPVRRNRVRRALGPAGTASPARPSARGRYGRRLEARPPVALAEGRAAHHGADRQRGRGLPVASPRTSTPPPPAGRMMMQMVGAFAEFERAMIRERTSAGLAAARAEGRIGGRRKKARCRQASRDRRKRRFRPQVWR